MTIHGMPMPVRGATAIDFGFNFRESYGFTVDETYSAGVVELNHPDPLLNDPQYPQTFTNPNGDTIVAGWSTHDGLAPRYRDENAGVGSRLAGISRNEGDTFRDWFYIDAAPGNYELYCALGRFSQRMRSDLEIFDGVEGASGTGVARVIEDTAAGFFSDATGVHRTWDDWNINNLPISFTMTASIIMVSFRAYATRASLAHFRIKTI